MRINGNKLCPRCGFKHTLVRPFSNPTQGWDCPGCERRLTTPWRRQIPVIFLCSVILFYLLTLTESRGQKVLAMLITWMGFGPLLFHLSLDVRAVDQPTEDMR